MKSEVTGSGKPVVLVPGGLTGWLSWKPHAEQLSSHYKVIRVQLLSVDFGLKNALLPPNYSVNFETNALEKTLDNIGISVADFVAWSYGAEITLNFALNNPNRVRSLALIEPPAIWVLRSRGPLSKELLEQ
ncbi:MAG: alpha/beta hydrolase [Nitrososphaerales archaeon]|nr:alpha/beta hydrolase [Nitrososphaerales archaeon]